MNLRGSCRLPHSLAKNTFFVHFTVRTTQHQFWLISMSVDSNQLLLEDSLTFSCYTPWYMIHSCAWSPTDLPGYATGYHTQCTTKALSRNTSSYNSQWARRHFTQLRYKHATIFVIVYQWWFHDGAGRTGPYKSWLWWVVCRCDTPPEQSIVTSVSVCLHVSTCLFQCSRAYL